MTVETTCHVCDDYPAPNAYVCQHCMDGLHGHLHALPGLVAELNTELVRQSRKTQGRADNDTPLAFNPAASEHLQRLREITTWAVRVLHPTAPARLLLNLPAKIEVLTGLEPQIALHPDGPGIVTAVDGWQRRAISIIDTPPEKVYVGRCDCGTDLYAPRSVPAFPCPNDECDTTWDTDRLIEWRNQLAHDQLMSLTDIALLAGIPVGILKNWANRDRRLARKGQDRDGTNLYRYGDALSLNQARHADLTNTGVNL